MRNLLLPLIFFVSVTLFFFYKTFLYGFVPIPGDLLVAEYTPWKTYSYLGYTPSSYPNKAQYFDTLRQLYPWKTFSIASLKQGEIPFWNPYNFSGSPLLANFQSAVFYPLNIVYFFFSQITAWSLLVILQPLLASLFTYLFMKKIGVSSIGSFFSAISFAFSSFLTVWLEYNTIGHVIVWLPSCLLAVEHLLQKVSVGWILALVLSLCVSAFGGHPQIFAYLFLFVVFYSLYRVHLLKKSFLPFCILFFLALGIAAVQLVPGIELIRESARSSHQYDFLVNKILIQPWQLVMLFVPDFFGNPATRNYWISDTYVGKVLSIGVVPLLFVLFSFMNKNNKFSQFFVVSCIVVILFATSNPLTQILYKWEIPLISASSPTLSIFIFCFSLSVLCGFGVDAWRKEKTLLKKVFFQILPVFFVFAILWMVVIVVPKAVSLDFAKNLSIVSVRTLSFATAVFATGLFLLLIGTVRTKLKYVSLIALLILHTGDLFYSFHKFNPFSPPQLIFPKANVLEFLKKESGINRFWGYGAASVEANFATQYNLFSPNGYDPLYPRAYGEFIQSSSDGKIKKQFTTQTRSDAVVAAGYGEDDLPSNLSRLKILDLLGVRYVLDRKENVSSAQTFPKDRFRLVYEKDGWKIFENLKVTPRVYLTSDYKVFQGKEQFERLFFNKDFNPSKTVLLEEKVSAQLNDSNHFNNLEIVSYTPNKIILNAKTKVSQLLFLSDTYYPGWRAFIDGAETKIYRADYAFRAVVVPKGDHQVIFTFTPSSFKLGLKITIVSILMLFFVSFLIQKQKYHE